jgi:hypothetical protein
MVATNLSSLQVAGVPTMGMGGGIPATTGNVFFVDSGNGSNGNTGQADNPFATLDYAIGKCTANNGDIIVLGAGHAETVSGASGITFDVAGVTVVGLGEGASRPTFTFSATASTIVISAASVQFGHVNGAGEYSIVCKPSIDEVVTGLSISGASCTVYMEWQDPTTAIEALTAITTTAAADKFRCNLKYLGQTGGNANVNAVILVGVNDAIVNIDFYGKASTAVVEFLTTACTNVQVYGYIYNTSGTAPAKTVVDTAGSSTWWAAFYDGTAGASISGGSAAALAADDVAAVAALLAVPSADAVTNTNMRDVVGNKTDAAVTTVGTTNSLMALLKGAINWLTVASADAVTNASAKDVIGNKTDAAVYVPGTTKSNAAYLKGTANLQENLASAAVASITTATIFTIAGGPIEVLSITGEVTTNLEASANNTKLVADPTVGSAVDLCAVLDVTGAAAGGFFNITGTLANALVLATNGVAIAQAGRIVVPAGIIQMNCAGTTTGAITWRMRYKPLAKGVTVS